ncbi:hypothetical protein KIN20_024664 [Parelaphostrongylus tenuis]|uniref:Uncharacterized protein n=1 Tax=Parelaphostrongylus tenuis TaxID=148309 RepID=A0AAD5QXM9_PARTN|nr:hypothetical protein KIN20_024664 [Parelaphostrongylus tenuis]
MSRVVFRRSASTNHATIRIVQKRPENFDRIQDLRTLSPKSTMEITAGTLAKNKRKVATITYFHLRKFYAT